MTKLIGALLNLVLLPLLLELNDLWAQFNHPGSIHFKHLFPKLAGPPNFDLIQPCSCSWTAWRGVKSD